MLSERKNKKYRIAARKRRQEEAKLLRKVKYLTVKSVKKMVRKRITLQSQLQIPMELLLQCKPSIQSKAIQLWTDRVKVITSQLVIEDE